MTDDIPTHWLCLLPTLGLLSVSGQDAAKLLQGQTTCDLIGLPDNASTLGALCTPQGRALALFRAYRAGAAINMLLPGELIESVQKRLHLYVLRTDVRIEDAGAQWRFFGVGGANLEQALTACGLPWPGSTGAIASFAHGHCLHLPGDDSARVLFVVEANAADTLLATLQGAGYALVDPARWQLADIRTGLPTIHAETVEAFVPQMLNLDRLGGISFNKGCYTGQEIVARSHYLGTLKRRMYHLECTAAETPAPGTTIFQEGEDQGAGTVITAAASANGRCELLAVLNIRALETGKLRLGSRLGPTISQLPLPYPIEDPS